MWPQLLLISSDRRDRRFAQQVALAGSFALHEIDGLDMLRRSLILHPQSVVLWDASQPTHYSSMTEAFETLLPLRRVFAITDRTLDTHLTRDSGRRWGNHILRRVPDTAIPLYARLFHASLGAEPSALSDFLERGAPIQRITLKRSTHKHAAIEAIQSHLQKRGIGGRLAAQIAQAADELILNAIFDAPCDDEGQRTRHPLARDSDFELSEREQVDVELASSPGYLAIAVSDQFGRLRREDVMQSILLPETERLGLGRIHGMGFSLVFTGEKRARSTAILICPEVENFKAFRSAFHFLGMHFR